MSSPAPWTEKDESGRARTWRRDPSCPPSPPSFVPSLAEQQENGYRRSLGSGHGHVYLHQTSQAPSTSPGRPAERRPFTPFYLCRLSYPSSGYVLGYNPISTGFGSSTRRASATIVGIGSRRSTQTIDRPILPKLFPCNECHLSFARKNDLTRHQRIHTGAT